MKAIRALVKRHPLVSFYALAFAITWDGLIVVVGGPGEILGTPERFETRFPLVLLAWLAGPSVAGILMTGLVHGRAGLRDLLARMTRWVAARWYAAALLTAPLSMTAALLALSLYSPEYLPGILTCDDKASVLLMGIFAGLTAGIFEELVWTGFAIPRMRLRYGVLATGLIVGVLWGAYHFSVIQWSSSPSGALSVTIIFVSLFAWLPAYRVLMVWV